MRNIHAIIIDDEPAAINVIRDLIAELTNDIVVDAVAANGVEAVRVIIDAKPDLVFLDVNMPHSNGIEVLKKIPEKDFEVIFTTGSADFALKAIKLDATDYLLKPIDPSDFILAIEKARKRIFMRTSEQAEKADVKIQLHSLNDIAYIKEEDILFITGMGSYSQVVTNTEKITVSKSIGQMEERVSKNLFYRCHTSYLVNLMQVIRFSTKDGFQLIMNDGSRVEVSRRSKDGLLKRLDDLSR